MDIITLSEPIKATAIIQQSSTEHRDDVISVAKVITTVSTQDELEIAVGSLKELAAITKETELARKSIKAPILAIGKQIDGIAEAFTAPVEKEKLRITGLVNSYQRKQLEEQQAAERKAREEQAKAERESAEARRKIEEQEREIERQRLLAESAKTAKARAAAEQAKATAEAKLLDAELDAEDATLAQQSAQMELTAPTSNPKGLTTRVRYDFEILNPIHFVAHAPLSWTWNKDTETLKFDRAGFLKVLNNEQHPHPLLPEETQQQVIHSFGIRIFKSVSVHVR